MRRAQLNRRPYLEAHIYGVGAAPTARRERKRSIGPATFRMGDVDVLIVFDSGIGEYTWRHLHNPSRLDLLRDVELALEAQGVETKG